MKPVLALFVAFTLAARGETGAAKQIALLNSPDIAVRRAAVEAIQTLDDPAITAACLPLLKDEGLSIRRQAARAIGSRFFDVPPAQQKSYVDALKKCATAGPGDNTLLSERAIGLLTANYRFPSFSIGPKKKWVLYERRKLPVIAPVKGGEHLLLSPIWTYGDEKPELLKLAVTNEPAADLFAPRWHPSGNAVAFTMILQRRFFHPIFIWVAGTKELKTLDPYSLKPLLPARYPDWGTTSDFVRWDGDKAIIRIYDCQSQESDEPPNDPGVLISYDIKTGLNARVGG